MAFQGLVFSTIVGALQFMLASNLAFIFKKQQQRYTLSYNLAVKKSNSTRHTPRGSFYISLSNKLYTHRCV